MSEMNHRIFCPELSLRELIRLGATPLLGNIAALCQVPASVGASVE